MKFAFDEIRADEYSVAHDACQLGMLLINKVPEHEHLQSAVVAFIFRDDELRSRGRVVAAEAILVERILQSERRYSRLVKWAIGRILGTETMPDFIVLIDRNIWGGLDLDERLALIDHELMHCAFQTEDDGVTQKFTRDGSPKWRIRGHDVEEFTSVIGRNGLWNDELREMARVMIDHLTETAQEVG